MTTTKQFKKNETVECIFLLILAPKKNVAFTYHLRKHNLDKFAG